MTVIPTLSSEALIRVRLDARHGIPPMDADYLRGFCVANCVTPEQVRTAEQEGRDLRASGVRCLCSYCEAKSDELGGRERLRQHYAARRHAELEAQGTAYPERVRLIEEEINAGAAFQCAPVTVIRTKGAEE